MLSELLQINVHIHLIWRDDLVDAVTNHLPLEAIHLIHRFVFMEIHAVILFEAVHQLFVALTERLIHIGHLALEVHDLLALDLLLISEHLGLG